MSDDEIAKVEAVDVQHPWNWRMGTGYHDPGDTSAYEAAADRTYLLVDVWGYSPSAAKDSRQTPDATLTCLRPKPVKQNSGTAVGATNTTLSSTTPTTNSGMLGKRSRPIMGLLSLVSFALVGV